MDLQGINDKVNDFVNTLMDKVKDLPEILKNLPQTVMGMPIDEQAAVGAIVVGVLFVATSIILW